ncbi:unnamed protein product [Scytosiphon promiscuus]
MGKNARPVVIRQTKVFHLNMFLFRLTALSRPLDFRGSIVTFEEGKRKVSARTQFVFCDILRDFRQGTSLRVRGHSLLFLRTRERDRRASGCKICPPTDIEQRQARLACLPTDRGKHNDVLGRSADRGVRQNKHHSGPRLF